MKSFSAAPCFSGACGLCNSCSLNNFESTREADEKIQRAEDLCKMIDIDPFKTEYNKKMNEWSKQNDYLSPIDPGEAPLSFKHQGEIYQLKTKFHNSICDDPYCKASYVSSHSYIQSSVYSKLPVYGSEKGIALCGVCITESMTN